MMKMDLNISTKLTKYLKCISKELRNLHIDQYGDMRVLFDVDSSGKANKH